MRKLKFRTWDKMKIEQKPKFQPITITLETEAEAQALRDAVLAYRSKNRNDLVNGETVRAISNWFHNNIQLLNG